MTLGLDHDCAEGRFYWSKTPGKILSANYNGTDEKIYIENDIETPSQLAMDWISRRLYWADSGKGTIEVASLENPNVRTVLIYEDLEPYNIAVDPLLSKLYWVNSTAEPTIEWSNLDGTNRQVLIKFNVKSDITSIESSTATGELCYIENRKKEIKCIEPFSKEIRTIRKYFSPPSNLIVTAESYFYNSLGRERFHRIYIVFLKSNGEPQWWPVSIQREIYKMTAVSGNCPLFDSPCARNNGDCPENTICLVNPCVPAGQSCVVKKKCIVKPKAGGCYQLILDN